MKSSILRTALDILETDHSRLVRRFQRRKMTDGDLERVANTIVKIVHFVGWDVEPAYKPPRDHQGRFIPHDPESGTMRR